MNYYLKKLQIKLTSITFNYISLTVIKRGATLKDNSGKEFTIFSDIPSKIAHYRNLIITLLIIAFWGFSIFNNCLNSPVGSQGPYVLLK
ncbi:MULTISPECIES: hypothetical protein [Terrisporobacter]|uniref:hypothetical protein n=1 Tax=Terrisporobacter TaxID=1505652 RepID=UPI001A8E9D55|nr:MULTISPECIES: hypothetical protein [Terrisporobacter]MBN9646260.1 hypothetical protein [Terrisporobacter glycolicus]